MDEQFKKILIIGADSTIGRSLYDALIARGYQVVGTTRRASRANFIHLDLEDPRLDKTPLPQSDIAVFCAAVSGFADCRNNAERARQINVTAPNVLARRLALEGTHLVCLSSSSVFDWSRPFVAPETRPCPSSAYGALKAENEAIFSDFGKQATIIRFAKVLAPDNPLLIKWLRALRTNHPVVAFSDMGMAPITLGDATSLLLKVVAMHTSGIYQYSSREDVSYFDAATHIAKTIAARSSLVMSARASEHGIPHEEVTTFSSMNSDRAEELLGMAAPNPFVTLDRILNQIQAAQTETPRV